MTDNTSSPDSKKESEELAASLEGTGDTDEMNFGFIRGFFEAMISSLTLTSPPLYRYPYRNTLEAFRSDWKHIRRDIDSAQQHHEGHPYE